MKKTFILLFFVLIFTMGTFAQVTIGSEEAPTPGAILELKSDTLGFLPPRVNLVDLSQPAPLKNHVKGVIVYNLTVDNSKNLQEGLYTNNGSRWERLLSSRYGEANWFYMPSFPLDVTPTTTDPHRVQLYLEFEKQMSNAPGEGGSLVVASEPNAPIIFPEKLGGAGYYFYVTSYDDTVFSDVTVDSNGWLSYKVIGDATDATYMNIVLVEK